MVPPSVCFADTMKFEDFIDTGAISEMAKVEFDFEDYKFHHTLSGYESDEKPILSGLKREHSFDDESDSFEAKPLRSCLKSKSIHRSSSFMEPKLKKMRFVDEQDEDLKSTRRVSFQSELDEVYMIPCKEEAHLYPPCSYVVTEELNELSPRNAKVMDAPFHTPILPQSSADAVGKDWQLVGGALIRIVVATKGKLYGRLFLRPDDILSKKHGVSDKIMERATQLCPYELIETDIYVQVLLEDILAQVQLISIGAPTAQTLDSVAQYYYGSRVDIARDEFFIDKRVIGKSIKVMWTNGEYYVGKVTHVDTVKGLFRVYYADDDSEEWISLSAMASQGVVAL
eukprot:Clim_evm32s246 gene=Clim_evmTU32s246